MGEERDEDGWKGGGGWEGRERREMRMGRRRTRRRREERRKGIKEEGRRKRRAKTKRDVSSSFSSVVQCRVQLAQRGKSSHILQLCCSVYHVEELPLRAELICAV